VIHRTMKRGNLAMRKLSNVVLRLRVCQDGAGQDLVEYALMSGFVALAASAMMPGISHQISIIFSRVASVMTKSTTQGS